MLDEEEFSSMSYTFLVLARHFRRGASRHNPLYHSNHKVLPTASSSSWTHSVGVPMRVWAEAANHSWAGKSQRAHTQVITIVRLVIHDGENGDGDGDDFFAG